MSFLAATLLLIVTAAPASDPDRVDVYGPGHRYVVRFAEPRSDGDEPGRLFGVVSVLDTRTGRWRTVRTADGRRGDGIFEGFSIYDDLPAWSPDGRYLAYWDDYCVDEPAVAGGVVCHTHDVHVLELDRAGSAADEVVLGRYEFGGWVAGRPHSLWQLDINSGAKRIRTLHGSRGLAVSASQAG
jgi:hypothetical protein